MSYFLRPSSLALACALVVCTACAESPENADPEARNEQPRGGDGGRTQDDDDETDGDDASDDKPASAPKDAGVKRDASTPTPTPRDAGGGSSTPPKDAGSSSGGGSNPIDDLLGGFIDLLNPPKDAGAADAGKRDGG